MIGVSRAQTIQYIGAPTTTVISRGNFRTDSIFYLPKRSKAPTDTAAFRYQISDSSLYVWSGSQWIKAGGSGTISGSGITGYLPQFLTSTTLDTSALFTIGNRLGIGSSTFAYTSTNTANIELNGTAGGILGFKRNDSAKGYLFHNGDNMELANTAAGSISFNTNSATRGSIASDGVWRLHNLAGTGDRVVQASSNGTLSATASVTGLVDTLTISTRAWRQKGIDSLAAIRIAGSGTTNRSAKFTASGTIGNGSIADSSSSVAMTILSSGNIGISTVNPAAKLDVNGASIFRGSVSVISANSNLSFNADYSALGDIPSGSIIFSNTSTNQNVSIVSAGAGTAGTKVVGASYNGTNWRSMLEYANVASGEPTLLLAKTAGFVAIGSSTPSTLRLLVQGQGAGAPSASGTSQTGPFRLANTFSATVTDFGFDTNNNAWIQVSNKDNLGIRYNLLLNQNGGEVIIGNSSDAGVYALQVTGNIYTNQTLTTGAPTSGSAKPWRLGEAATVSPTSPNRTIRVEIDGTVYYLHAKTTND